MTQNEKVSEEVINKMREMRKTHTQNEVAAVYGVCQSSVNKYCKGVIVNLINKRVKVKVTVPMFKNTIPVTELKFSDLSEEDQKRYSECKPSPKEKVNYTYVGF